MAIRFAGYIFTEKEEGDLSVIQMTVEDCRRLATDTDLPDDFTTALDEQQGRVFTGDAKRAFIIIEITS